MRLFKGLLLFMMFYFLVIFPLNANQIKTTGRIRGQVLDESTQSPLPIANIMIEKTQLGAAADMEGVYIIENVPPGIYNLRFTMMGYETRMINNVVVNPGRTTWQEIELKQTILKTDGITVTAGYFHEAKDAVVSNRSMDFEEIRTDPGSAEDIQRVIQALPAVVSGADQDNEIIVRGGMPGENLFVLDEIEISNPNHFGYQGAGGGPINMINTYFVRRVDFYAGAFPARYGDKASSVMDISLRDGDRERFTGHGYLGMSGAGIMIEGPVAHGRGSYILSARKSFLDLIISSTGLTAVPKYYSFQGKIVYDLNSNNKLILNGIYGDDRINIKEDDESGYSRGAENVKSLSHQYALGLTWRTLFGKKGFSKITLSQTFNHWDQYVYREDNEPYYENLSTEIERTIKANVTYLPVKRLELNFGGHIKSIPFKIYQWSEPDTIFYYNNITGKKDSVFQVYEEYRQDFDETTLKAAAFCHLKWQLHPRLSTTLGLRSDYFDYTKKRAIDPRLGFSYALNQKTNINLAFGKHSQSPAYIQVTSHPKNKDLDYKKTSQVVLGLEHLFREDIRGTFEVFYKDYKDVPISESELSPNPFDASYGRLVNKGRGYAKGLELFLQKKMSHQYHFTISYSYSISKGFDPRYNRSFNWDYDYGHVFTFIGGLHYDLRNRLWYQKMSKNLLYKIFAWILPFADQIEFGIRWRYLGGRPYTEPRYFSQFHQWFVTEDIPINSYRWISD
jgi:hypothetical protein